MRCSFRSVSRSPASAGRLQKQSRAFSFDILQRNLHSADLRIARAETETLTSTNLWLRKLTPLIPATRRGSDDTPSTPCGRGGSTDTEGRGACDPSRGQSSRCHVGLSLITSASCSAVSKVAMVAERPIKLCPGTLVIYRLRLNPWHLF